MVFGLKYGPAHYLLRASTSLYYRREWGLTSLGIDEVTRIGWVFKPKDLNEAEERKEKEKWYWPRNHKRRRELVKRTL